MLECIGFSEIDRYAEAIYRYHRNHRNYGDATKIVPDGLPDFDFLIAGFPCQAFSIAGKRQGFDDARGTLFFEIARILSHKRPAHFLLENVRGLVSHNNGETISTILGILADLDYFVEIAVLNSKDYGVCQNRERAFFIGHAANECSQEILSIEEGDNWNLEEISERQSLRGRNKSLSGCLDTRGVNAFDRQDLDRLILDFDKRTVRRLTPIEHERFQGLSDDYSQYGLYGSEVREVSDTQRYKTTGNAMTVNVIEAIITRMIEKGCLE